MDVIFIIAFLILLGYFLKSCGLLAEKDKAALNNIVLYMALPALIFVSMLRNVHAAELGSYLKLTFFILLICVFCTIVSYFIGKALKLQPKSLAAFVLVCACGNTALIGFPVIAGFYGNDGFTRAIFCDAATLMVLIVLATYLSAKVGGQKVNIFRQILKFPPTIAWFLSLILILCGIDLSYFPAIAVTILDMVGAVVVPLIMFSLGISLSHKYLKIALIPAIFVTAVHSLFAPAAGLFLTHVFQFSELDKKVAVLQAGMPPAMTSAVLSELYDFDTKLVSAAIFLATGFALVSIPIWHILLEAGWV